MAVAVCATITLDAHTPAPQPRFHEEVLTLARGYEAAFGPPKEVNPVLYYGAGESATPLHFAVAGGLRGAAAPSRAAQLGGRAREVRPPARRPVTRLLIHLCQI